MNLIRVPLDEVTASPQQALLALRGDTRPFALVGRWAGGAAILGSEPARLLEGDDAPWDELRLEKGDSPLFPGWFGYLGFGLGATIERLGPPPPRPVPLPLVSMGFYDHVLRLDAAGRWWFEALGDRPGLEERLGDLRARLASPPAPRDWRAGPLAPRAPGYAGHRAAVADCVERIAEGEIFQANLCLRFEGSFEGDAMSAFAAASAELQPAYGAYFGGPWGHVVSLSPELFLRRTGSRVLTRPIKGTAARDGGSAPLLASAKDAAEHVMILDLMRNDLGRVARFGTVEADERPRAEAHPGVWHLVSDVRAELADGVTDGDLLRATFPPGSVTGAPKVQSLHVISRLEATGREVYTGAIGMIGPAGLELSVAIRTFEISGGRIWLGAGGGIVADSDPDAEVLECYRKAAPLAAAMNAGIEPPPARRVPGTVPARRVVEAARPDPRLGVYETIAVRDGVPLRLDAHLARLAASAGGRPGDLRARVLAVAGRAPTDWARLRIAARFGGVDVEVSAAEWPGDARVDLVPVTLPGGLGAHKWLDRRLIESLPQTPLFVDLDGSVLEAGFGNVWIVEGEELVTPPADGRILPGVTRAAVLRRRGREEPISIGRLQAADAVLITSAIRLVTRASDRGAELAAVLRDALGAAVHVHRAAAGEAGQRHAAVGGHLDRE